MRTEIIGNYNLVAGKNIIINIIDYLTRGNIQPGPYLVNCQACNKQVSKYADACGRCGHPVRKHFQEQQRKEYHVTLKNYANFSGYRRNMLILISKPCNCLVLFACHT